MANKENDQPYPGTRWWTLDTTDATAGIQLGDASKETIGSAVLLVRGNTWTGSIVLKARLPGAASALGANAGWVSVAYQDLNTGSDVAGGTGITTDGLYAVRLDLGAVLGMFYTHSAGTVDVLERHGMG